MDEVPEVPAIKDDVFDLAIRLREAFNVIQPEIAQSKIDEAEKKARTTYRDDFNTRQGAKVKYSSWYHGDSDNDGEEYDPCQSSKRKAKSVEEPKKKRVGVQITGARKRQKKFGYEALPNSLHQPFLTLNVTSDGGKTLLAKLAIEHHEYLAKLSTKHEGQQSLDNSVLFSAFNDDADDIKKPRSLRNGKILEPPIILKRKENNGQEAVTTITKHDKGKAVVRPNEQISPDSKSGPGDHQGVRVHPDDLPVDKYNPLQSTVTNWEASDDPTADEDVDSTESVTSATRIVASHKGQTQATAIYITDSDSDDSQQGPTNYRGRPPSIDHNSSLPNFEPIRPNPPNTTYITTAFAHPINFQAVSSCDFCSDYRFGMLGYGLLEIQVKYSRRDATDFIELGGGHAQHHAPTRMCFKCAASRMQITRCKDHKFELTKIRQYSGDLHRRYTEQFAEWDYIIHNHGKRSNKEPIVPACSICINPAMWACCTYQARNGILKPCRVPDIPLKLQRRQLAKANPGKEIVLQDPIKGCGLRLCFQCHMSLRDTGFRLEDATDVTEIITAHNDSVHFRADLEFLFKTGSVWIKYVM